MNIVRLDGVVVKWKPVGKERANASKLHKEAVSDLRTIFGHPMILEECRIEIDAGKHVYFDIYLPQFNLFVEINGEQHYRFNPHFHKNPMDFMRQKRRDNEKLQWCRLNNFPIASLPYNKREEWPEIIRQSLSD